MTDRARRAAFLQRFFASLRTLPDGRREMDPAALVALVQKDPAAAAAVIRNFRSRGDPRHLELALSLAWAYAMAAGDPAPYRHILRAMGQARPPARREDLPREKVLPRITVGQAELAACDIGRLRRLLSLADAPDVAPAKVREVWARLALDFDLNEDPREVVLIPEARRFVAAVHAAMPYVAGCLHPDPDLGQFRVYFGCLADLEALTQFGMALNLGHPSVVARLREALTAIGQVAPRLGLDPAASYRSLLAVYPAEAAREFFPEWATA
jgi:hypothetical protein